MKTAYILFCQQKPKNNKSVLDLLTHFCREHNLKYGVQPGFDYNTFKIDGNDYRIDLQEKHDGSEPVYWMIRCSLKSNLCHF